MSGTWRGLLSRRGPRLPVALVLAGAIGLVAAPAALANSTQSANWAGYAAHRSGVRFTKVVGSWRQPSATCASGSPSYTSIWVGLGGYNLNSQALEQIGSEVDCSPGGKVVSSVWYELVPAASHTVRMTVAPNDELTASVVVIGHRVELELRDLTRRTSFTRTLHASLVDVSSAEWIVEAPSECSSGLNQCQTLNLADFGSTAFSRDSATTTRGHRGSLSDHRWSLTRIVLASGQRHFIGGPSSSGPEATPSSLSARGSAFTVYYSNASGGTTSQSNGIRGASAATRMKAGGARLRRSS